MKDTDFNLKRIGPKLPIHCLDPRIEAERVPISYAIEDDQGCHIGECLVAYRGEFGSSPQNTWVLAKIWIEPEFRRRGWPRRTWAMLRTMYDGIQPEPPLSKESWEFFVSRPEVDMNKMFLR
jgi:hypothetical protein